MEKTEGALRQATKNIGEMEVRETEDPRGNPEKVDSLHQSIDTVIT